MTTLAPPPVTETPNPATPLASPANTNSAEEAQAISNNKAFDLYDPSNLKDRKIDWVVLGWIVAMHVGALAAPFFFSWSALAVCVFLHWLTCSVGICLGMHRYLAHRSMKLKKPAEFFVLFSGAISGEGSPLTWVATHRLHHQRSDQKGDPHSPTDGPWWSHILWLFTKHSPETKQELYQRYTPELLDRPMLMWFERMYGWCLAFMTVALFGVGFAIGGLFGAISFLVWGMCVRMVFSYHSTWFVNSATHLWGYRNYETRDHSRNLWWVALLSYGEGWHNNHHAHPGVAPAGHRWWEIDTTWWVIKGLRAVGLAYDVKDKIPERTKKNKKEADQLAA